MLSVQQLQKIDPTFKALTEEAALAVRDELYRMATLAFDAWKNERDSKNPLWSQPAPPISSKLAVEP